MRTMLLRSSFSCIVMLAAGAVDSWLQGATLKFTAAITAQQTSGSPQDHVVELPSGVPSKIPAAPKDSHPSPPVSTGGGMEILSDTGGVDFGPYMKRLDVEVQKHWNPLIPDVALPPTMKSGVVTLEFAIMKDGTIKGLKLANSSGDDSLDRAAWGAIISSTPLPRLPAEYAHEYLLLRTRFFYNPSRGEKAAADKDQVQMPVIENDRVSVWDVADSAAAQPLDAVVVSISGNAVFLPKGTPPKINGRSIVIDLKGPSCAAHRKHQRLSPRVSPTGREEASGERPRHRMGLRLDSRCSYADALPRQGCCGAVSGRRRPQIDYTRRTICGELLHAGDHPLQWSLPHPH